MAATLMFFQHYTEDGNMLNPIAIGDETWVLFQRLNINLLSGIIFGHLLYLQIKVNTFSMQTVNI